MPDKPKPTATVTSQTTFYLNLTHEHLEAIGRVTVSWSFLEHAIEVLLWGLANLKEPEGLLVTHKMNLERRLDIVKVLYLQLPEDEQKTFKELLDTLDGLKNLRNDLVHAYWSPVNKKPSRYAQAFKLKSLDRHKNKDGDIVLKPKIQYWSVEDITELNHDIRQLQKNIQNFAVQNNCWPEHNT